VVLIIRKASLKDFNEIYNIEIVSFKEESFSRSLIKELLLNFPDFFLVAEFEGKVVGYISAVLEKDCCHIYSLAVLPDFRGKGIGSSLLNELLNKLKEINIKKVFLEVKTNNMVAIKLYEKFNFKIKEVKRKYYPDGSDAYVMELIL
jgi:ribosomal-protein-alanine acetyltransferase